METKLRDVNKLPNWPNTTSWQMTELSFKAESVSSLHFLPPTVLVTEHLELNRVLSEFKH